VLPTAAGLATQHLAEAHGFVEALATIQTTRQVAIAYAEAQNCADLQSGHILLDASVISTCPFRPQATFTERLDILGGLCLHEVLHLEYSSADLCRQSKERGPLFAHIQNILEDEYIESRLPATSPGYADYLLAARSYMFDDAHRAMVPHDASLLNVVLLFVRRPQRLRWQDVAPYGQALAQISHILTPFPASSAAVYRATEHIVPIIQRHQPSGPEPTEQLWTFLEATAQHRLTDDDGLTQAVTARLRQQRSQRWQRHRGPHPAASTLHSQGPVVWETPQNDRQHYEQELRAVRPYIQRLRRCLQGWDAPSRQRRTGRARGHLDRRLLHTIPQENDRFFAHQSLPETRRLTFVLLIDESGSMAGRKIMAARQVAILCREALAPLRHVELYIFGHSADAPPGTTTLFRYWAPGCTQRYRLGRIGARKNNRDGVALWAVAQEVKRCTCNRDIILLVLSDGLPHAQAYAGDAAVAHTRAVVKRLQRDMVVIQVAIAPELDSSLMFEHAVRLTDLATLPAAMMRLVRTLLA
jgi:Mg-chelatase subunit ChlD